MNHIRSKFPGYVSGKMMTGYGILYHRDVMDYGIRKLPDVNSSIPLRFQPEPLRTRGFRRRAVSRI